MVCFPSCYLSVPQFPSLWNGYNSNSGFQGPWRAACARCVKAYDVCLLSSLPIPASSPSSLCNVPPLPAPATSAWEPDVGKQCHRPRPTWKGGPDVPQSRGGKFSCPDSNSGFLMISFTVFNSHANFVTRIYTWSSRHMVQ